jgi:hypothetical protein
MGLPAARESRAPRRAGTVAPSLRGVLMTEEANSAVDPFASGSLSGVQHAIVGSHAAG